MSIRRLQRPKQKHRPSPFDEAPPPNLKFMSNSERGKYYRRRRKLYGKHLEEEVDYLREDIAALTVSRQVQHELSLSQRRTPLGRAARIVVEYCSLFSHGAPVRLAVDEQDASASLVAQATNVQRGFLSAVMIDNVRFGEFLGLGLMLEQWERYSLYHSSIEWTMTSLNIVQLTEPRVATTSNQHDEGPLVVSITADLRVRFSRRTIEEVFPHLVGDEALTQSLIGLEVTYPCVNHFHFSEHGKIEWYAPEVGFVDALMKALKSPELVARVMGDALIEKHMIGDESDGRELVVAVEEDSAATSDFDESDNLSLSEESIKVVANACTSWAKGKRRRESDEVVVVSDDEPYPELVPEQPNRLRLDYILGM